MNESSFQNLIGVLPDPSAAERFLGQFRERNSFQATKLIKDQGLLSDVLTLASFSPLFSATLLQNPEYVLWLGRKRKDSQVRNKEELLESLARFAMTNSGLETQELLAKFRRRELLRIYLRDIRGLGTIAEITEEISHLADAILEFALRLARQELDNRFGGPTEPDEKGRAKSARFCVVALGKLGSNELNYSSDIDLLFLYSADGKTSGNGSRGVSSNREYFIKLSEFIVKLVGHEGGAYRVDLRLRPHGRVGALAVSMNEAVSYYAESAQAWERQTLIRSRSSAGDSDIFRSFFRSVEGYVFSASESVENALQNVRLSKDKINREHTTGSGFNVKLGIGGIREIEFIAQALQLAHGGKDRWLRAPHTLISLARLCDRSFLAERELTELSDAYEFLRRLEHRLQMENGLQTHIIPVESEKRSLIAAFVGFSAIGKFEERLQFHTQNVNRVFRRIFGDDDGVSSGAVLLKTANEEKSAELIKSAERSEKTISLTEERLDTIAGFNVAAPFFAAMLTANPQLLNTLPDFTEEYRKIDYEEEFRQAGNVGEEFAQSLANLRRVWSRCLLRIAFFDALGRISLSQSKAAQTRLAEASINAAFKITKQELQRRCGHFDACSLALLGLGKLGGRGMDYGSDIDIVLIYDDQEPSPVARFTHAEFYTRAVEVLVTTLSSFTREGNLYRVDLRLRPDGKNGATSMSKSAFLSYFEQRAAIWELLAYVKVRGVAGDLKLATDTEFELRNIIHKRALALDPCELMAESRRVRERLTSEKSEGTKSQTDIKFGPGGMLDIYFAMRYLQLLNNIPDDLQDRSTLTMLGILHQKGALSDADYDSFFRGYEFLSKLDHAMRLTVGRSTLLPADTSALSRRLGLSNLSEVLTLHRLNIREAFDHVLVPDFRQAN